MGVDFTAAIGGTGFLSNPLPITGFFDLNMLNQHNFPIEHDASLSRMDAFLGDHVSFKQEIFDQVLDFFEGTGKPHGTN